MSPVTIFAALLFAGDLSLVSPDGAVRLTLRDGVRLGYEIAFQRQPVIELSPLGIVVDGVALGENALK